ncbi:MAG: hypothetical protein U5R49_27095 [Deltaproteobacteria bacterium]|nr:hypothetical protein [Deltaproteobacteria bacterium]
MGKDSHKNVITTPGMSTLPCRVFNLPITGRQDINPPSIPITH